MTLEELRDAYATATEARIPLTAGERAALAPLFDAFPVLLDLAEAVDGECSWGVAGRGHESTMPKIYASVKAMNTALAAIE